MSLKRDVLLTYSSQAINAAVSLLTSILIARIVGVEIRGEYAIYTNSLNLFNIWLALGLPSAIIFFVASKKIAEDQLFSTIIFFSVISCLVLVVILYLLASLNLLNLILPHRMHLIQWRCLFLFQYFMIFFNSVLVAFFSAKKLFMTLAVMSIINSIIPIIIYSLFYFYKNTFIDISDRFVPAVLLLSFTTAIQLLITKYYFVVFIKIKPTLSLLKWVDIKNLLSYSLVVYIANSIQYLTYKMDIWFLNIFCGSKETGIYAIAVLLAQIVWLLPIALASVLLSYSASSPREEINRITLLFGKTVWLLSLVLGICCWLSSYVFIPIFYGIDFSPASNLIGILLLGIVPFSIITILGAYFAGINKVKFNLEAVSIGFVICLLLDYYLIQHYASIGASIASAISYVTICLYMMHGFTKFTHISSLEFFWIRKSDLIELKQLFYKNKQ